MKVAVYGTLRKKGSNFAIFLSNAEYLGRFTSEPKYTLYSIRDGFPGLKLKGNNSVIFEVYNVDVETRKQIDVLEGFVKPGESINHYEKKILMTPYGRAFYYVYNKSVKGLDEIDSGDWIEYIKFKNQINSYV